MRNSNRLRNYLCILYAFLFVVFFPPHILMGGGGGGGIFAIVCVCVYV